MKSSELQTYFFLSQDLNYICKMTARNDHSKMEACLILNQIVPLMVKKYQARCIHGVDFDIIVQIYMSILWFAKIYRFR